MRLVFVNHMHPDTPHVSGMRAWFFARELAKRGHQVVQVCQWRGDTTSAPPADLLGPQLQAHDWQNPLLLAIQPQLRPVLNYIRSSHIPIGLRKALVAWNYVTYSGMATDFSQAVQPYLKVLAREFEPQATWGVNGSTDCWLIAQRLGHLATCPWVADMKDSWDTFIPSPLRGLLARRFCDMVASTANAEFNARVLDYWFPPRPVVIYSGVDPCFIEAPPLALSANCLRITLTGSVYNLGTLQGFVAGLRQWLETVALLPSTDVFKPEVIYAGASAATVAPILGSLSDLAQIEVRNYLPLSELAALCRSATVNTYLWNPKTFHHKLLELLSCGRPVIAFPGETEESRQLAVACGGELHCPSNPQELMATLDNLALGRMTVVKATQPGAQSGQKAFTWAVQANRLETVLQQVVLQQAREEVVL
ncbi:MAG: hypothetical protein ACKO5P_05135 [Nodosilinea sp.]